MSQTLNHSSTLPFQKEMPSFGDENMDSSSLMVTYLQDAKYWI